LLPEQIFLTFSELIKFSANTMDVAGFSSAFVNEVTDRQHGVMLGEKNKK
jgi:hypothetical protein